MKYVERTIRDILSTGEKATVECKLARNALPETFWETYSAFANTDGGVVLLGVRDGKDGTFAIEGVDDSRKIIADFWNAVHSPNKVSSIVVFERHVQTVACGDKIVVTIEIPRADRQDRPVYVGEDVFKGTFRRNGEGDYHCPRESVEAMIRDRGSVTADACVLDELSVADLNSDTIRRYRGRFSNLKRGHVWNELPDDEFLTKIGAARMLRDGKAHPTLAGLVAFGNFVTIMQVLPNYFLDYRERLSGESRWNDRVCAHDATWSGNVYDFFFKIHDRITADVKTPFAIAADGITRIDDTDVHKVVREALANAIVHADYHGRQGIVVEKRFQTILYSNPGTFRVRRDVALAGGTSDARNAALFNIFALVDIGERSGMGLSNLFGVWKKCGFERPEVVETYDPDRTVLTLSLIPDANDAKMKLQTKAKATESAAHKAKIGPKSGQNQAKTEMHETIAGSKLGQKISLDELPASARQVLSALREDSSLTQRGLGTKLGLARSTVNMATATLIKAGYLRRVGSKRGGHWEVLK